MLKKLAIAGVAIMLAAVTQTATAAVTPAQCSDALYNPAGADKSVIAECVNTVRAVLKENGCTKFNEGGVYETAAKIWKQSAAEHPIGLAIIPFPWEDTIKRLVVPRKDRC